MKATARPSAESAEVGHGGVSHSARRSGRAIRERGRGGVEVAHEEVALGRGVGGREIVGGGRERDDATVGRDRGRERVAVAAGAARGRRLAAHQGRRLCLQVADEDVPHRRVLGRQVVGERVEDDVPPVGRDRGVEGPVIGPGASVRGRLAAHQRRGLGLQVAHVDVRGRRRLGRQVGGVGHEGDEAAVGRDRRRLGEVVRGGAALGGRRRLTRVVVPVSRSRTKTLCCVVEVLGGEVVGLGCEGDEAAVGRDRRRLRGVVGRRPGAGAADEVEVVHRAARRPGAAGDRDGDQAGCDPAANAATAVRGPGHGATPGARSSAVRPPSRTSLASSPSSIRAISSLARRTAACEMRWLIRIWVVVSVI